MLIFLSCCDDFVELPCFSWVTRVVGTVFWIRFRNFLSNFFENVCDFVHLKLILYEHCSFMDKILAFWGIFLLDF